MVDKLWSRFFKSFFLVWIHSRDLFRGESWPPFWVTNCCQNTPAVAPSILSDCTATWPRFHPGSRSGFLFSVSPQRPERMGWHPRQTIPHVPVVFVPAIRGPGKGSFLSLLTLILGVVSRIFAMAFWLKFDDNRYQTQCASKLCFSGRFILSLMIFGMICWFVVDLFWAMVPF